jgi:predicted phosphodiesterase
LRALIVADIHANLEALQSVVEDASGGQGFDQIWSLGDVVGYGPDPAACIDLLREHDVTSVAGNHDLAACGVITPEDFNEDAAAAIWWTISQLDFSHYDYLRELSHKLEMGQFTIVHGSAREPYWREYVDTPEAAKASFELLETPSCLVGHSHRPQVWSEEGDDVSLRQPSPDSSVELGNGRLIINPGAVGQPRDSDPRAAYAIYDSDRTSVSFHRVAYDRPATQLKMKERGLPRYLWMRLEFGL